MLFLEPVIFLLLRFLIFSLLSTTVCSSSKYEWNQPSAPNFRMSYANLPYNIFPMLALLILANSMHASLYIPVLGGWNDFAINWNCFYSCCKNITGVTSLCLCVEIQKFYLVVTTYLWTSRLESWQTLALSVHITWQAALSLFIERTELFRTTVCWHNNNETKSNNNETNGANVHPFSCNAN